MSCTISVIGIDMCWERCNVCVVKLLVFETRKKSNLLERIIHLPS